jgi:hypothetical protein
MSFMLSIQLRIAYHTFTLPSILSTYSSKQLIGVESGSTQSRNFYLEAKSASGLVSHAENEVGVW